MTLVGDLFGNPSWRLDNPLASGYVYERVLRMEIGWPTSLAWPSRSFVLRARTEGYELW